MGIPLFKNQEHINLIKDAMFSSSNEPGGTSYRHRFENPKYTFAGKTGSSQIKRFTEAQREAEVKQESLPYKDRDADIKVEPESCNIFDMYSVIERISRVVKRNPDAEILVNLATGSKPSAIGGMIACMANDIIPYYVQPKGYGEREEEEIQPVSYGWLH